MKLKLNILIIILLFAISESKAQNSKEQKNLKEIVLMEHVQKELQVSKERASEIAKVLKFNQDSISILMKNKSLDYSQKQQLIRKLLKERQDKIQVSLTQEEQMKLKSMSNTKVNSKRSSKNNDKDESLKSPKRGGKFVKISPSKSF